MVNHSPRLQKFIIPFHTVVLTLSDMREFPKGRWVGGYIPNDGTGKSLAASKSHPASSNQEDLGFYSAGSSPTFPTTDHQCFEVYKNNITTDTKSVLYKKTS